jgi:hypothetical protein
MKRARAEEDYLVPSKKYLGVFWDDEKDQWAVRVKLPKGGWADCGHFLDEEEAARHYDECLVELTTGHLKLNFPED